VDRRLTVTGIFLLRFRGEQIGSPPTDFFPDKPNNKHNRRRSRSLRSHEPQISHSGLKTEKRELGAKPNSLLELRWCRRGDSNPHGFPHHPLNRSFRVNGEHSAGKNRPHGFLWPRSTGGRRGYGLCCNPFFHDVPCLPDYCTTTLPTMAG
jgi:hypothetical protein